MIVVEQSYGLLDRVMKEGNQLRTAVSFSILNECLFIVHVDTTGLLQSKSK